LSSVLALSGLELLIVYAIPIAVVIATWLTASLLVFGLVRFGSASLLGADLRHRVEAKQQIRSGRNVKLSFRFVALALAGDNCVQATALHRLASNLARRRLGPFARAVHAFSKFLTNVDISPRAEIGPGLFLYHGLGTVIGKGSRVGRNVLICQNVTLGGGPTIGNDVCLWAGAKVIGRVTVGDRAEIGANGVVVANVPSDTIAVGIPATRQFPAKSSVVRRLDD
jgi:serine acetyltransferase